MCDLIDLRATSAKSVALNDESATRELFVVRKDDGLYVYENVCLHTGAHWIKRPASSWTMMAS